MGPSLQCAGQASSAHRSIPLPPLLHVNQYPASLRLPRSCLSSLPPARRVRKYGQQDHRLSTSLVIHAKPPCHPTTTQPFKPGVFANTSAIPSDHDSSLRIQPRHCMSCPAWLRVAAARDGKPFPGSLKRDPQLIDTSSLTESNDFKGKLTLTFLDLREVVMSHSVES